MKEVPFKSQRAIEAEISRYKFERFDKLADLALAGFMTIDELSERFTNETVEDSEAAL